ncbi:MAG: class I SAM-dependent methyltransferase [Pyrinomonadaceae bacterium]
MSQLSRAEEIASAYDQWAQTYEAVENATRDMAAKALRTHSLDLHDRDVLEIGCGTGLNTRYLAQQSRNVLALDFSAGMLEQARANVSAANVRFVQSDIQLQWPLAKASVDLVICMLVLEHVSELDHTFQEASRVLRRGGEFFVCELHPFRQLQGHQAQFKEASSGNVVLVPAYLHNVSDYVNASIQHGFEFIRMSEWRDDEQKGEVTPLRLLSIQLRVP